MTGFEQDRDLITPEVALRHLVSSPDAIPVRRAIVTWGRRAFNAMERHLRSTTSAEWPYGERNPLSLNAAGVGVLHAPVGAPGTILMMEELRALGARTFVGFGTAGGLDPSLPPGSAVLPTHCIAEEGTSSHYGGDSGLKPSLVLARVLKDEFANRNVDLTEGGVWTTDAPYRETIAKVNSYRDHGIRAVDMETSAMYAFGRFRDVEVCNILIVADVLGDEWDPTALFSQERLVDAVEGAARAVVSAVEERASG